MKKKFDIFLSYRRIGSYDTAKHIFDLLDRDGYSVSFDIDTLRNGNFDDQLIERVNQCKDFLLFVDQHTFDRILDSSNSQNNNQNKDYLRLELANALKENKNIVPIFLSGVSGFPNNLPKDIIGVTLKNGPEYSKYHFDSFYDSLKHRFLISKPRRRIIRSIFISAIICVCLLIAMVLLRNYVNVNRTSVIQDQNTDIIHKLNELNINYSDGISTIDAIVNKLAIDSLNSYNAKKLFCGYFSHVVTQSIMWDIKLNPIDKNVSIDLETIYDYYESSTVSNITDAIGYCGTDFECQNTGQLPALI